MSEPITEIGQGIADRIRMALASPDDPIEAVHMIFVNSARKMEQSSGTQVLYRAKMPHNERNDRVWKSRVHHVWLEGEFFLPEHFLRKDLKKAKIEGQYAFNSMTEYR